MFIKEKLKYKSHEQYERRDQSSPSLSSSSLDIVFYLLAESIRPFWETVRTVWETVKTFLKTVGLF